MDIETVIKQLEYWDKYGQGTGNFQYNVYTNARDMLIKFKSERDEALEKLAAMESQEPEQYDTGFLNDFGGGNVSWWHDYIRAELDRAHDHYAEQFNVPSDKPSVAVPDGFREIVEAVAHIGVDFGYGNFVLSQEHIEKARALLEAAPSQTVTNRCPSHESEGE